MVVGPNPHSREWIIIYYYFSFLPSRQKPSVELPYLTCNTSNFRKNWGTECLNTRSPLPIQLYAGYSVKLIFLYYRSPRMYGSRYNIGQRNIKMQRQSSSSTGHVFLAHTTNWCRDPASHNWFCNFTTSTDNGNFIKISRS